MDIKKERKLAMLVVNLDNAIHDLVKAHATWFTLHGVTLHEFLDYYKKHGLHNVDLIFCE